MAEYLIGGIAGLVMGAMFYFLAVHQVSVRCTFTDRDKLTKIKDKRVLVAWMILPVILFVIISVSNAGLWTKVMMPLFIMMALNISAVDYLLRRIPNSLLLGMILLKIADIVVEVKFTDAFVIDVVGEAVFGLLAVYIICTLPAIVGITMGAGDVKYCSTLGFVFGIVGFAQAMFVMAVLLVLYWAYLKKTKKGNMKTSAPMGPFLSAGALIPVFVRVFTSVFV
jgi:prepilin signal peptidase PulO-like enzyme (type II secretory pathway)